MENEIVIELERDARTIWRAGAALLEAEMYDRWGPTDDVAQREAIEAQARDAHERRRAAIARVEQRVRELRVSAPQVLKAWADAHLALLADFLGRAQPDGTAAFVAKQEQEGWQKLAAGELDRVEQNTYYVHYDRKLYAARFGFDP